MVLGHGRIGVFDCKIWEGHIIDFMIILHRVPAWSSLLEYKQYNGNNHATHSFSNGSESSLILAPADTYICTYFSISGKAGAIGFLGCDAQLWQLHSSSRS